VGRFGGSWRFQHPSHSIAAVASEVYTICNTAYYINNKSYAYIFMMAEGASAAIDSRLVQVRLTSICFDWVCRFFVVQSRLLPSY
jgi:hypothetical protein